MTNNEWVPWAGPNIVEFQLAGVTCYRWFNDQGILCASGPPKAKRAIKAYLQKVARFLPDRRIDEYLRNIRPWGPKSGDIKLHAVLELNSKGLTGKGRCPELVIFPHEVTPKIVELKQRVRRLPPGIQSVGVA
jgi:hypothetical protein